MKKQKAIVFISIGLSLLRVLLFILQHKSSYLEIYDHQRIGQIYSNSQYTKGTLAETPIGDDGLYAFSGYYYLMQGGDVSAVNFENPPLGKYLIGLSILLFQNAKIISVIYGLLLLFVVYKIASISFNRLVASFSILLFSFSPLFLDQLNGNLLDLPLTLCISLSLYFYLLGKKKPGFLILSSLFLALSFSVKFFPGLIFFVLIYAVDLYLSQRKSVGVFLKSLVLIPFVYLSSHFVYFIYHPSLVEFIKYQLWLISWRRGNPYIFGNILRTIFFGKYQSWWDPQLFVTYNNWSCLSVVIPLFGLLSILLVNKKRKEKAPVVLFWAISLVYFIYVACLTTGVEKYLLPVYPLWVILDGYFILGLFSIIKQKIWKS